MQALARTRLCAIICVLSFAFVLAPSTATGSAKPAFKPAILKLTEEQQASATVLPAHAPVPAASTGIGPGSQIMMTRPDGSFICTANFVWTDTETIPKLKRNGKPSKKPGEIVKTYYLGAAGHCFVPEGKATTHGPDTDFDRTKTSVSVCVSECEFGDQLGPALGTFVKLGPLAYARQTQRGVDFTNDFGVVEIPADLVEQIRPGVPVWEGPSSVQDVQDGGAVCLYGNGTAVGAVFPTKARAGVGEGLSADQRGWHSRLASAPGDSGSALVTCEQDDSGFHGIGAAGILTHIGLAQNTAQVIGTTVSRAVEMAEEADLHLRLMLEDGSEVDVPKLEPSEPLGPVITADESRNEVGVGGTYSWTAGPFTRSAPTDEGIFSAACSGSDPKTETCDYEFFDLDVPLSGAELSVTVSADDATATDFDLYVFDQNGEEVMSAASAGTPPEFATATVTQAGDYTVAVNPFTADNANYSAVLELKDLPPAPDPVFNGEIAVGGPAYEWIGDPPGDVNPVFSCAEGVHILCSNERFKAHVPAGGAKLVIDVKADSPPDDFDLCVYTPSNEQTCFGSIAVSDEHAELDVTEAGVYRVGVSANAAFGGFSASASLQ